MIPDSQELAVKVNSRILFLTLTGTNTSNYIQLTYWLLFLCQTNHWTSEFLHNYVKFNYVTNFETQFLIQLLIMHTNNITPARNTWTTTPTTPLFEGILHSAQFWKKTILRKLLTLVLARRASLSIKRLKTN